MLLDLVELVDVERSGLEQDRVGDRDLADVVQSGGEAEAFAPFGRLADRMTDLGGEVAHAVGVLGRVAAAKLGERCEPLERLEVVRVGVGVLGSETGDEFGRLETGDLRTVASCSGCQQYVAVAAARTSLSTYCYMRSVSPNA